MERRKDRGDLGTIRRPRWDKWQTPQVNTVVEPLSRNFGWWPDNRDPDPRRPRARRETITCQKTVSAISARPNGLRMAT
ncbi:MAG TPA: hypothetical protein VGD84_00515, partial [Pseudonocardiaceae bacterium]